MTVGVILTLAPASAENAAPESASRTASVLVEAGSGCIVSGVNADERLPAGTLAKLMTALLAAEAMDAGKFSESTPLTCSSNASGCGGAIIWLAAGEKIVVSELFTALLAGNANDAALVFAEAVAVTEERFTALMNQRAAALGMNNTVYANCTGMDSDKHFTTAADTALLCRELIKHEELFPHMTVWRCFVRGGQTEIVNSNELVKSYDGLLGLKYSSTEKSGSCCALAARRDGNTYISVTLGFAEKDECLSSAKALLNTGFSGYMVAEPPPFDLSRGVSVHHGVSDNVRVAPQALVRPVIPKGAQEDLSAVIYLPAWLEAPVRKGQSVGKLAYYRGDKLIYRTPIVASEDVDEVSSGYTLRLLLLSLIR